MVDLLRAEREGSSLDLRELTAFVDGGEAISERRKQICEGSSDEIDLYDPLHAEGGAEGWYCPPSTGNQRSAVRSRRKVHVLNMEWFGRAVYELYIIPRRHVSEEWMKKSGCSALNTYRAAVSMS